MKPKLRSKIIIGARALPETEVLLRAEMAPAQQDAEINLCVFEVKVDRRVRYCCWAGGKMILSPEAQASGRPPLPSLTLVGQAAVEALLNLPFLPSGGVSLIFQQLHAGATPLQQKIIAAFRCSADTPSVICFFGDLAVELDGKMGPAFNLDGAVPLEECVGMAPPGAHLH